MIKLLTTVCVLLTSVAALAYAAGIATVRWWRSDVGWQQAMTAAVYVVVIPLALAARLGIRFPDSVRLACWVAIAAMMTGTAGLVWRERARARRNR